MGSNRKRPFGYRMELGESVLHPAEAETVRWIYDSYLAGASYNALVDKLQERGIPYDGDKPWNKNMAARILADRRYTGEGGFPSIISEAQFQMVQARRQERTTPCQKSPAQKELRKLCRGSPPAWVERQVLGLLNRLIQYPELITCPVLEEEPPPEAKKLRRELDGLLHRPPVDEAQARTWPSGWPPSSWTPSGRRSMKPSAFGGCSRDGHPWQNWSRNCSMRASAASPSATGRSPSC